MWSSKDQIYFLNLDKYISRLLLMKLAGFIKAEVSNISISITDDDPKIVSERKRKGLQYIEVYIVHKLHNSFKITKTGRA